MTRSFGLRFGAAKPSSIFTLKNDETNRLFGDRAGVLCGRGPFLRSGGGNGLLRLLHDGRLRLCGMHLLRLLDVPCMSEITPLCGSRPPGNRRAALPPPQRKGYPRLKSCHPQR